MTRLVDTGELRTPISTTDLLKSMLHLCLCKNGIPNGIPFELTDNERFLDGPVTDAPSKFNDTIERDT